MLTYISEINLLVIKLSYISCWWYQPGHTYLFFKIIMKFQEDNHGKSLRPCLDYKKLFSFVNLMQKMPLFLEAKLKGLVI
jgi:hypothetical protein